MTDTKRYFAPVPNRALVDHRIHGLHFRFFGVVAAHDRFGQNGLGSTLSLQRYADILGSHKQSIARVRRELIDWGYLKEAEHPTHSQMKMLSVVYDADADRAALSWRTVSPQTDSSYPLTGSPHVHGCAETVSPQADTEETHLKVKEETRPKTKKESSLEGAHSGECAPRDEVSERRALYAKLAITERRLKDWKEHPSTNDVPILKRLYDALEKVESDYDGYTGDPTGARAGRLMEEVGCLLQHLAGHNPTPMRDE